MIAERGVPPFVDVLASEDLKASRDQVVEAKPNAAVGIEPAAIRAWLADRDLAERADLDPSLIGENDRVLQISLGHLLGEEFAFDFLAGRDRPA